MGAVYALAIKPKNIPYILAQTIEKPFNLNTVTIHSTHNGELLATLVGDKERITAVKFNPEGSALAILAPKDNCIKIWNPLNSHCIGTIENPDKKLYLKEIQWNSPSFVTMSSDCDCKKTRRIYV